MTLNTTNLRLIEIYNMEYFNNNIPRWMWIFCGVNIFVIVINLFVSFALTQKTTFKATPRQFIIWFITRYVCMCQISIITVTVWGRREYNNNFSVSLPRNKSSKFIQQYGSKQICRENNATSTISQWLNFEEFEQICETAKPYFCWVPCFFTNESL